MSNTNRDYAIIYDIKNSTLVLSRPLVFYITDKNTSNIFARLVTKTNIGDGVDQYTDIENASNYIVLMRTIKPNDEVINIKATQREPESIFEFNLTEDFKDIPGTYICELMISTMVNSKQELITSDAFTYEVKRSVLSKIDQIIEHKDTTVEKLLNELDASKAELDSQIKDIVNDCCLHGASPNLADNTSIIQSQLDKKGRVIISKKGTYYVSQLKIDSYTTFELYEGVILKQLPNTKKYILTNKDHVNGNKYITLIGGEYDNNSLEGNSADNTVDGYKGFGIHLENVRHLDLKNVTEKNSSKYAISICKCENVRVNNIYLDTFSDGIHFQPPLKNCIVDTVTGSTGDDMVSFTLGDYSLYRISNKGNFEDVTVRNINAFCNKKNGQAAVKVVGSGDGNAYYFKNFSIENVYGDVNGVNIEDDLYDSTSDDLKLTKVINFKLKNIFSTDTLSDNRRMNILISNTGGGDITIDDIDIPLNTLYTRINISKAVLDKLIINNCTKKSGSNGYLIKNRVNWEWKSKIKQLYINNFNYSIPESSSFYAIDLSYIECDEIYLNNVKFTGGDYIVGGGLIKITSENNTLTRLFVDNFLFDKCQRIFRFNTQTECYIQNGINTLAIDDCIAFIVGDEVNGDGNYCRVQASNVEGDMTLRALNPSSANVAMSINMNSGIYNNLTSRLTPRKYDKVICTTSDGNETNKGFIIWNGTNWVKLV